MEHLWRISSIRRSACYCPVSADTLLQFMFADIPVGSGRSFTAYVFAKSAKAQRAQHALLADASAAQPLSPQDLAARRVVVESPSPITTPHIVAASRQLPCQIPVGSKAGSAVTISVVARAEVVNRRACTDTCTDQAEACGMSDRSCDAHELLENSFDQGDSEAAHHHSHSKLSDSAHCDCLLICSAWQDGELLQALQQCFSRNCKLFLHTIKPAFVVNQQKA